MMMKRTKIWQHDCMNNDETLENNRLKNEDQTSLKNGKLDSQLLQKLSFKT